MKSNGLCPRGLPGDKSLSFGPLQAGTDAEWNFDRQQVSALKNLCKVSGGQERLDLSTCWQRMDKILARDISTWFYILVTLILLVDFFLTHTGLALFKRLAKEDVIDEVAFFDFPEYQETPEPMTAHVIEDLPEESTEDEHVDSDQRRNRYKRASLKK